MAKKRPPKKATKNLKVKRTPLKVVTYHKRKTNAKSIKFTKGRHDPEKVLKTIENFDYSKFDYLRRRNHPIIEETGKRSKYYKPPQGIVVIVTIKKGKNEFYRTRLTPLDFIVTKKSLEEFVKNTVKELLEDFNTKDESMEADENEPDGETLWESDSGDVRNLDPAFISEVTVKFIYGKTEV